MPTPVAIARALAPLALVLCLLPACPRPLTPAAAAAVPLPCPAAARAPDARLTAALLTADGVDAARAAHIVGAARAYWLRYGIDLAVTGRERTRLAAVVTDLPPRAEPTDTREALSHVLAPAFSLVGARTEHPAAAIDIVLLPRLAAPGSAATSFFTRLDGFTLSPLHRDALRGDPEASPLYAALARADFRPTVFIAVPKEAALPPGQADLRLAHELGHVFGLDHAGGATRLMSNMRGKAACPTLDEDEQRAVSAARSLLTATPR